MIFKILRKLFKDKQFNELKESKEYYKHGFETITILYNKLFINYEKLKKQQIIIKVPSYSKAKWHKEGEKIK
jgi:hypothetical protein